MTFFTFNPSLERKREREGRGKAHGADQKLTTFTMKIPEFQEQLMRPTLIPSTGKVGPSFPDLAVR